MEIPMKIQKFSAFLVIEYSKLHCSNEDLVGTLSDFKNDDSYKEIFKSIELLLKLYGKTIDDFDVESFDNECILSSQKKFMAFLMSRCLKLSEDNSTFFEFLLVCTYISKTVKSIFEKIDCCKVLKVAADCLQAVFCRKYWDYFLENDDFLGFSRYCRQLNESSSTVDFRKKECETLFKAMAPDGKGGSLRDWKDIDDISLNSFEEKLLKNLDQPFFASYREHGDFLITIRDVGGDSQDPEMKEWECVPEKVVKTGIRCSFCTSKCFQYTGHLAKIFPRCSNVPEV